MFVHTRRPTGENNADGVEFLNGFERIIERVQLRVNTELAYAACDKLRILSAKIEHEDGF